MLATDFGERLEGGGVTGPGPAHISDFPPSTDTRVVVAHGPAMSGQQSRLP
jgi:hypothetical protein